MASILLNLKGTVKRQALQGDKHFLHQIRVQCGGGGRWEERDSKRERDLYSILSVYGIACVQKEEGTHNNTYAECLTFIFGC